MLGTSIVNLIWRNLATIPGALEWTWYTARPLYFGPAPGYADAIRRAIELPAVPSLSSDILAAAGLSNDDVMKITDVLDSYYYTKPWLLSFFRRWSCILNRPCTAAARSKITGIAADAVTEA